MNNNIIKTQIKIKDHGVGVIRINNVEYISLTDIARYQNSSDPSFTVKNWLRRITTIDYIGLWERINNNDFNLVEFDQIKTEYGKNSFAMSPTQWIKRTNAIGIVPKLTEKQIKFIYAEEADVLNVALFGMTAKQWRELNPKLAKKGNIRDYTDLLHLVILNNL